MQVDRITFGIQNVSGCVSSEETEALVGAIEGVLKELDPQGTIFHMDRSKYDLEVILNEATSGVWDKGAGVEYLEELHPPGLDLTDATVLVCGDTASDLPMVKCLLARNPANVKAVFVNASPQVQTSLAEFPFPFSSPPKVQGSYGRVGLAGCSRGGRTATSASPAPRSSTTPWSTSSTRRRGRRGRRRRRRRPPPSPRPRPDSLP